jgi:hypothetical protein
MIAMDSADPVAGRWCGSRQGDGVRRLDGQVAGDRFEVGERLRGVHRVEALLELLQVDPALGHRFVQDLRHLLAVLVRDPDAQVVPRLLLTHVADPSTRNRYVQSLRRNGRLVSPHGCRRG